MQAFVASEELNPFHQKNRAIKHNAQFTTSIKLNANCQMFRYNTASFFFLVHVKMTLKCLFFIQIWNWFCFDIDYFN